MNDSADAHFGSLLRRLRTERKLSQEDLAERAKMSAAAISALERGSRRAPYRSSVDLLADGLGIDAQTRTDLHALAEHWRKSRALPTPRTVLAADAGPAGTRRHNLPAAISSFVGREKELDDLQALIERCRLLTIVGPGGIGKTRVALELAAQVLERYPDGAWFVDLTNVRDPEFIAAAMAAAIGLREAPNEPIDKTLLAYLANRKALLILDSSEHLLEPVAKVVKAVLSSSAAVSFAATSREPLHLTGEQIYRLGPLPASVELFVERAREADPSFALQNGDRADVQALCARLEHMPLAIELACARLSSLTLKQLAARLKSALTLTSKDATLAPRHRALRETIAWSYGLLSPTEQHTLRVLAVFAGGCTIDAIGAIVADVADIDDAVESLVDKSLLQVVATEETDRYRLLDVVREYARERLDAARETEEAARRHALYYARRTAAPGVADLANLRVALEWSILNDAEQAAHMVKSLSPFWRLRGMVTEARAWIDRVLDVPSDTQTRAALLCRAAGFAAMQEELGESLRFASEALSIYRASENLRGSAEALFRLAEAEHHRGSLDAAEGLYREARRECLASEWDLGDLLCTSNLGMIARQRGDPTVARTLLSEAIVRAARLGEASVAAECSMALAWVQLESGELAESRELFEKAFVERSAAEDSFGVLIAREGLATVSLVKGRLEDALFEFYAMLKDAREFQARGFAVRALDGISAILAARGQIEHAARMLGLAERLFNEFGGTLRDSMPYDLAMRAIDVAIAEPQRSELLREGARMRVSEALVLLGPSITTSRS